MAYDFFSGGSLRFNHSCNFTHRSCCFIVIPGVKATSPELR